MKEQALVAAELEDSEAVAMADRQVRQWLKVCS